MMPIYLTFILLSIHASVQADQDYGTLWARGAYADARARWPSRITVVNRASTSAPFTQALAGPNRVITTKGVDENNATRFAEYFI